MSDEIQYYTSQNNIQYRHLTDSERASYNEHVFRYETLMSTDEQVFMKLKISRIAMPKSKDTYKNALELIAFWNRAAKYKYVLL